MVNLLPIQQQARLRGRYYLGLLSSFIFLLAVVFFIGAALLAPSYFLAESEAASAVRSLNASAESVKLYQSSGIVRQVSLLKERLMVLTEYQRPASTAVVLSALTGAAPSGIQIQTVTLTFTGSQGGEVVVSGKAKTRAALVNFGKKLEENNLFSDAEVPLSGLVSETNLDFSLPFTFDVGTP